MPHPPLLTFVKALWSSMFCPIKTPSGQKSRRVKFHIHTGASLREGAKIALARTRVALGLNGNKA